ncbi:GntR family transcriptional regulator [Marasmitruncus massiliensis]|uniref:GntR family transcriptional regulator n=1 Tax=Marasmitruncus massiliensis TaxID=1944642 RepID=UPI000C7C0191|nr:GntR family transcriptional regulator [Marasmitruncus massiliensis]
MAAEKIPEIKSENVLEAKEHEHADLSHFVSTSLVDLVASKIRTNIYLGKYPAGQKLVVRELSEEFGVSHTPVKDALNRLIAEGYIEALPRRSMVVRMFTNSELIESIQIRLMSEIFFAEEIIEAARQNTSIVSEMQEILEKMRASIEDKEHLDYETWVSNETKFHCSYMRLCGNKKLFTLYKGLDTNRITYLAYLGNSHSPLKLSTLESNLMEHSAIVSAIEALDVQRFINAVIRHLYRACEDYATDDLARAKIAQLRRMTEKYET